MKARNGSWDYVSAILKVIFLSSSDEKLDFKVRRKKWCKYFFRQEIFSQNGLQTKREKE